MVAVWLWSVAPVAIRSLRYFELFKIPCGDFSIAVRSVCCRSALAQLVMWSQYDRPWSRCYGTRSALDLRSRECTSTALRLCCPNCDHKTSELRQWATVLRTQSQSVSLNRSTVAVYSLWSLSTVGRFALEFLTTVWTVVWTAFRTFERSSKTPAVRTPVRTASVTAPLRRPSAI